MADQLSLRGGTTSEHATFTGANKEVTVDTTKKTLVVNDGATVGGHPLMRENASNSALALGSAATPSLKFTGDTNTGIYSPGADQVAISTGGSGRLFVDSAGNVGVGTSSPATALNVHASAGEIVRATVSSNTSLYANLGADGNGGWFGSNADLSFKPSGTERARITSAGLVGIGTSSPGEKLDVYAGSLSVGSEYVSTLNTDYKMRLRSVGAATNNNYLIEIGATGSGPQPADSDLTLATRTWNGSAYVTTEKARLTATGRLGIGTTSPLHRLDISGASARLNNGTNASTDLYFGPVSASGNYSYINWNNTAGSELLTLYTDGGGMRFSTAGSERLRITSAGLVGIGNTTGLNGTLGVSGNISLSGNGTSSRYLGLLGETSTYAGSYVLQAGGGSASFGGAITMYGHSHATYPGSVYIGASTGSSGKLYFGTDSALDPAATRMTLDASGRLGIGTTSPGEALHIVGNFKGVDGSGRGVQIVNGATPYIQSLGTSNINDLQILAQTIQFGTGTSYSPGEKARIDSSGRLLVGTSTARSTFYSTASAFIQIEGGAASGGESLAITRNTNDAFGGSLILAKTRGAGDTIVASGDTIGNLTWQGNDGSKFVQAARIEAQVDGTPGANDMPGRLMFSTTADGASSPTERMRIKSAGTINFSNVSTYADNAAALAGGLVAGDVYRKSDGTLMITY